MINVCNSSGKNLDIWNLEFVAPLKRFGEVYFTLLFSCLHLGSSLAVELILHIGYMRYHCKIVSLCLL